MNRKVPYLSKSIIDVEADLLLAEYALARERVLFSPVPIEEIIELHLKLTLEFRDLKGLFEVGDVLGAIWFQDRLIALDHHLDPQQHPERLSRYHFTLAHEVGHWRLHRRFFAAPKDDCWGEEESIPRPFVCRSSQRRNPVEWQADWFASCLLMPQRLIRTVWETWHGTLEPMDLVSIAACHDRDPIDSEEESRILEKGIRSFAQEFGVSARAMRIRLESLGLLLRSPRTSLPM